MPRSGLFCWALLVLLPFPADSATLSPCSQGARSGLPCELTFEWQPGGADGAAAPYKNELLNVEFRSPRGSTYLMHEFWDGGNALRVRFSPTEAGTWNFKVVSSLERYNNQVGTFSAAETSEAGLVTVANIRHWRTINKKPHLWLAAGVPFLDLDQAAFETWLDARKQDGFTHIRGTLLTARLANKPLSADFQPNSAYFSTLDDRILAAANRGFTLDLILADDSFLRSGILSQRGQLDPLVRHLVARYGGLNVTWQGIEHFEDIAGSRALLKELGLLLKRYDGFQHPRSSDARVTSSPLVSDGWMHFMIEASPHPELGAVEHQFNEQPEIHVIEATDPGAFRHELWNATTNGEYPSVSYRSLQNEANAKAIKAWLGVMTGTRHWELEPFFDVSGARAVGLNEVEYLAYAEKPGIVEIELPRHKYNPSWINPATGEEIPLKNYRGETFSRTTPDNERDWVLQVPRDGLKESMARYYYFESQDPPVQEVETDPAKAPFAIVDPPGDNLNPNIPTPFKLKVVRANRASRSMQYVWWGEMVPGTEGARVLGFGESSTFTVPKELMSAPGAALTVRVFAINTNGKAYEVDKVFHLLP
ncbi:MAG TPA: DUF5060 domain-containing protein [Bryobacteraceae bacterium]|nr:DUF5060 domain-containing protein [Bryobacteraceae bacterium]